MALDCSLKIDIFTHILPIKYKKALDDNFPNHLQQATNAAAPTLWDLDHRFRLMDKYGVMHVVTLCRPPIEEITNDHKKALDLTKAANDEMAELVFKYPDKFPAAIAALAMGDLDGSLKELERTIVDLKFRGLQLYSHINHKPLDSPEFDPIYEMMSRYNLPILIHPTTGITYTDYKGEKESQYMVAATFGWPYETTVAMTRLVFGGILERWPNLKVVTHHTGGMIPYYADRIRTFHEGRSMTRQDKYIVELTKTPLDYYKMFYADTALYGNAPALMLGRSFFGIDHLLFSTDFPFAGHYGERVTRQTIAAIEEMDISEEEKRQIYENNARKVFKLAV